MKKLFVLFFIFFIFPVFAEILNDFSNMCVSGYHRMYAVPKSFTCSVGQFLPANGYMCTSCPDGYTCSGGTYTFDSKNAQGLVLNGYVSSDTNNTCAINTGHIMNGRYVRKVFECNSGYYLPANVDNCTQCPANSYCGGGTYTFNETTNQGITQCPNTHPISSTGSSSINQCQKTLNWYSSENNLSTSTTCNYNGLINLPEIPPSRPGYIFNGWRIKND